MTDSQKLDLILSELGIVKEDVSELKADVSKLKADVSKLKVDVSQLQTDMECLNAKVDRLDSRVNQIQLFQENTSVPRLDEIESCYIDASERFLSSSERIEGLIIDMGAVKSAVRDCYDRLQKIS